jgi:hypothetical protein
MEFGIAHLFKISDLDLPNNISRVNAGRITNPTSEKQKKIIVTNLKPQIGKKNQLQIDYYYRYSRQFF